MTYMQALLGFAVLAGAMAMVPGLDMVMTMNEAIHYGRRNGIMAGFGIQCGGWYGPSPRHWAWPH